MCKIGVIDSGAGGISTLSTIMKLLPDEDYIYVADCSHSPYGDKSTQYIFNRLSEICLMLSSMGVCAIVIACNTATSAAIELLRQKEFWDKDATTEINRAFKNMIFVGVEPAVRPAFEELTFGKALVLLTESTARQQKFAALLSGVDRERIILSPQPRLAPLIESNLNNLNSIGAEVAELLSPLKTDEVESVVLGCTHYCLIRRQIESIFGAKIYDGNVGTAVRLYTVLKRNGLVSRRLCGGGVRFIRL